MLFVVMNIIPSKSSKMRRSPGNGGFLRQYDQSKETGETPWFSLTAHKVVSHKIAWQPPIEEDVGLIDQQNGLPAFDQLKDPLKLASTLLRSDPRSPERMAYIGLCMSLATASTVAVFPTPGGP